MSFTLYNSSAGSGKTYSLVIEYLYLVLANPGKYSRVLAVTFTNKAAAEMKERIIKYLVQISSGEMQDAVEDIKNTTTLDNATIKKNAKIVLKKILHNYSDFAVMTIDSFVFKIVSTFSLELDLPLNFEVEMSTKHIIAKTVNSLIEQADEFNYIGKTLKTFIFSKIEKSESWNYEQNISDIGKELFSEQSIKYLDELANLTDEDFLKIIQDLEAKQYSFQTHINKTAKEAVKIIERANLNPNDFKYKKVGIAGKFYKLSKAFKLKDFELGKRFSEGKLSDWVKDDSEFCSLISQLRDDKLENLREDIVNFYDTNIKTYISIIIILKDFPLTSLIRKLKILVETYKKNNNIVPISDFNKIVSNIIKKEIIPFIYWRVGNKYENYLLDEFQDTSSMQLNNLFPLIENSYSSGFHNIAVGDPKQSIYRWRASSPDIMNSEIESLVGHPFLIHKRLEYNYRSNKNIIEFNNLFFSDIFTEINKINENQNPEQDSENIYSEKNIVQKITNNTRPGGYVEIFAPEEKFNKNDFSRIAVEYTIKTIKSLINENYNYRDISILTRTNKEGSFIAEALFKEGIKVVSPDSLFLNSSPVIRFIISTLNYIKTKENLFLIEIIRFLKQDEFNSIIINLSIEKQREHICNKYSDFFHNIDNFQSSSLYETIESIIRIFKLNDKYCGYLQGFLEVVFNYNQGENNNIFTFLEFWEEKNDTEECSLIIPSGINAVSVMTIHKAKGLEFPIVLLPFVHWNIEPDSKGFKKNRFWIKNEEKIIEKQPPFFVEIQKKLQNSLFSNQYNEEYTNSILDNLNLLYVAFTRPIERLYIAINDNDKETISKIIKNKIDEIQLIHAPPVYYYGDKTIYTNPKTEYFNTDIMNKFNSVSWTDKIAIRQNTEDVWDSTDDKADSFKERQIERGNIMHGILSSIRYKEDKNEALTKALYSGIVTEEDIVEIKKDIEEIFKLQFEDGIFSDLFSNKYKIFCEKNILLSGKTLKPDRIIIRDDDVIIIEYKTGKQTNTDIQQVREYLRTVTDMGFNEVSGYIIYIRDKEIKRVVL